MSLLRRFRDHPGLILSLDFFGDGFRGPPSLLDQPDLWPQRVIVMTLASVGAAAGPDFARLEEIKRKAGNRSVIAAGGVRDEADIRALSSLGIAAALVATSLHNGTLTPGNSRRSATERAQMQLEGHVRSEGRFESPSAGATDHPARQRFCMCAVLV